MKKILTILLTLIFCSPIFAMQPSSQYGSTLHPLQSAVNMLHPPTDITIVNASNSYLYAVIPNSPVNDYIQPGFNDHIYNYDPNIYSTYLVLQDVYRRVFFSGTVCRLAIITITGSTGYFRYNIDSDLCN